MKLPDNIFGIEKEGAYKRALDRLDKPETIVKSDEGSPLEVKANLVVSNYVRIPGTNIIIARQETNKNLTWENTHYALADNGLFMPTPAQFMRYFESTKEAAEGKIILYDGSNKAVPQSEARDLWNYVSLKERPKGICWTWLDAKFVERTGWNGLNIETDHRVVMKKSKKELQGKQVPLETCVDQNGYAALNFNAQGLPIQQSPTQEYKQGENLYFWKPVKDKVAGFVAGSVGAGLSCCGYPQYSGGWLGVFACAEGTSSAQGAKQ